MIYVMSDIHGCYDEFQEMLDKINFSLSDTLYVLGDCVDRGKEPIKVLLDCLLSDNIKLLCGNHEWFLFECADFLKPWSSNTLDYYMNNYVQDKSYSLYYLHIFSLLIYVVSSLYFLLYHNS